MTCLAVLMCYLNYYLCVNNGNYSITLLKSYGIQYCPKLKAREFYFSNFEI
jgi:hypothetical protein